MNGTIGTSNEKGGVMFSAGFFKQEKVMAGDRDFSESRARLRRHRPE